MYGGGGGGGARTFGGVSGHRRQTGSESEPHPPKYGARYSHISQMVLVNPQWKLKMEPDF